MDNRKERLRFLLKSYIDSTITAEQLKELSNYLNQGDAEATIDSLMKDYWDKMDVSSPEPMLDPQVYQKTFYSDA
jgi:flagellar hook-associated protein FlgK